MSPTLRQEEPTDLPGIRTVNEAAFGRRGEADLVDALRASGKLVVSAVAVIDDRIVAHAAFSAIEVQGQDSLVPVLSLAPVAAAPDLQRQGLGSAVIRWGIDRCRQLGHGVIIVLGDPAYYPRIGFQPASGYGIRCPFDVPPEAFMVLELSPGAAVGYQGMVWYGAEFDGV